MKTLILICALQTAYIVWDIVKWWRKKVLPPDDNDIKIVELKEVNKTLKQDNVRLESEVVDAFQKLEDNIGGKFISMDIVRRKRERFNKYRKRG